MPPPCTARGSPASCLRSSALPGPTLPAAMSFPGTRFASSVSSGPAIVPLAGVREVRRAAPEDFRRAIRLFGSGGLFGYYGLFSTSRLGRSYWYVTDRSKAVVVVTAVKTALFSPDDVPALHRGHPRAGDSRPGAFSRDAAAAARDSHRGRCHSRRHRLRDFYPVLLARFARLHPHARYPRHSRQVLSGDPRRARRGYREHPRGGPPRGSRLAPHHAHERFRKPALSLRLVPRCEREERAPLPGVRRTHGPSAGQRHRRPRTLRSERTGGVRASHVRREWSIRR